MTTAWKDQPRTLAEIEDYGEHWYIVRKCGVGWPEPERSA